MDDANANRTMTLAPSPGPAEPVAQVGWRWHSHPGSVVRGEISVLAIIETLAAMSLAVLIAVKCGTVKHIAVGTCLAPLLLLRTGQSMRVGLRWFEKALCWYDPATDCVLDKAKGFFGRPRCHYAVDVLLLFIMYVSFVASTLLLVVLCASGVRFGATLGMLISHPLITLRAIPENWFRVTSCADARTPPEIVPGSDAQSRPGSVLYGLRLPVFAFFLLRASLALRKGVWARAAIDIIAGGTILLLHLPAILYRWSLKATSLIYAPLLWIVWTTFKPLGLRQRLTLIRRSPLSKIIVTYSCLVALAVVAKVYLYATWNGFATWFNSTWAQTLAVSVQPAEIPLWQVAMFTNACLAVGLFVFAGEAQVRYETGVPWHEGRVEGLVKALTFVRCTLTVYVIACNLYLLVTTANLVNLPRIKPVLFPWSA